MSLDFSRKKLRNRSFKGQDLDGANFNHADIRGAKFTLSNLSNANFCNAKAGLPLRWVITVILILLLFALISGIILGYVGVFITYAGALKAELAQDALGNWVATAVPLMILIAFGVVMIRQGLGRALAVGGAAAAMGLVLVAFLAPNVEEDAALSVLGFVIARPIMVLGAIGGIVLGAIAISAAMSLTRIWSLVVISVFIFLGIIAGTTESIGIKSTPETLDWTLMSIVILAMTGITAFIGWHANQGNSKYGLVQRAAITLSTLGGTNFRGANLTDANFSQAILKNTDFRKAILTCTNWHQARYLDQSLVEGTYLADDSIRDLVVSKNGHEQTFDRQDLHELNLEDANLSDASFIGANLSGTNLKQADLSRAKLVQAQLYRTDLTEATLTGAYIQDWAISIDTELRRVHCDFIYMRLPSKDDPDPSRKPDNRQKTFAVGEFTDFISPIIKTLDLYQQQHVDMRNVAATHKTLDLFHQEGLDPSAATIALKQLAEQFPNAGLEVVALEGRGNERVRVQARVNSSADRCELSEAYFAQYEQVESMTYGDIQALMRGIEEKDERIRSLESMVMNALEQDKYYVERVYNLSDNDTDKEPIATTTILVLAANPKNTNTLRLGEEVSSIQKGLERSKDRDRFRIEQRWAVTATDVRRALLDIQPEFVHFCGHGQGTELSQDAEVTRDIGEGPNDHNSPEGLVFENQTGKSHLVSTDAIANLFSLFSDKIECVVLNACYSATQAEAIAEHIPHVVGMKKAIGDRAAIEFAIGFYDALLAGRDIDFAFNFGRSSIQMEGIPEHLTPTLKHKSR